MRSLSALQKKRQCNIAAGLEGPSDLALLSIANILTTSS